MTVMIIRDIPQSGKLGLTVTFQGRTGLLRRTLVTPSNPRSSSQMAVRSALASMASSYDQLSDVQQQAWITAAANYKSRSRLGQSGPLTGLQLYTKVNCALLAIGDESVSAPPAAPAFSGTHVAALAITNTAGVIKLELTTTAAPPEGTMLWAAAPQKSGVRRAPGMVLLGTLNSPSNNKINITDEYVARFGAPPVNSRVFVAVQENLNGFEAPATQYNGRVPAQT
jgi:hypothetical protein